ncbi:DedA family protein [Candidatus Woesearchaeota archaeon]|nr:DedA family protein [Candidatus Woesearchaeota archaeon]
MFTKFVDIILHLDNYLSYVIQQFGVTTYAILFIIIFAETGFVFTPFLPGDSLLFAAGAFAALGALNVWVLLIMLFIAAVTGDSVNYWIGHVFGKKLSEKADGRFIKKEYLDKTEAFYQKYGKKTIILARFVPIVRTFAPFVAGIGKMKYGEFFAYNVIGGFAWIFLLTFAGYYFGQIPIVKNNFTAVIMLIILLSILPGIVEFVKHRNCQAK